MELIKIDKITPDPKNPRKSFPPEKMKTLKDSIKRYGIKNPIVVDENNIILDGERRYRAAKELGLKELPYVVTQSDNDSDRMIQQFHLQEQHEAWTPEEKAMAVLDLSDSLNIPIADVAATLGLNKRAALKYIAFAKLIDKKGFIKNDVSLEYAEGINSLKRTIKNIKLNQLDEELTKEEERAIEHTVISKIQNGSIEKPRDLTKIKDAVTKDPKVIARFLKGEASYTPDKMFIETKAKGAYHMRQVSLNAGYLLINIRKLMEIGDVKADAELVSKLKTAKKEIESLLRMAD